MSALLVIAVTLVTGLVALLGIVTVSLRHVRQLERDERRDDGDENDSRIVAAEQLEAEAVKLASRSLTSSSEDALRQAASLRRQVREERQ